MSYIEELRQRVETAERRFGLIDEQERRYSERLIGLMNALEAAQGEKQAEAAAHELRIAVLERENGELRGMLHALLLGIEAGSRDRLAGTLHDLDSRLSGLVGGAEEDAVATAEQAVASLIGDDALAETTTEDAAIEDAAIMDEVVVDVTAEEATAEIVLDEIAVDELAVDELAMGDEGGPCAASPVAEMVDRLADQTRCFPEPDAAGEAAAEEPAPSEPARKQA